MKKILLMILTAGLFSFGSTSCGSGQENAGENRTEATEEAADDDGPDMEEEADEAEDGNDKNDPR